MTMHPRDGNRILLVCRGLDPVGTGRQVELVAHGLRAAGCDVRFVQTTTGGSLAGRLAAAGFPVQLVGSRPVVDAAVAARLVGLAARLRPDVVLASGRSQLAPAAAVRLSRPRTRVIGSVALPPRGWTDVWAARTLDRLVVPAPAIAAAWARRGLPPAALAEIPPGIEAETGPFLTRAEIARRLGLDPGTIWTLCVAPLEAAARLERLLWAIDQLGVVHKRLEHLLVGAGPLRARVRRRAVVQELAERLHVLPHCDLLPDLLGEVRFVWQPGRVAFGGGLLDAMARGLPVVAVEDVASRQFVSDGETGRVVPADPESEFPRRAFNLLEDDALAARYGAAARARAAADFPAAALVSACLTLFARVGFGERR